MRKGTKERKKKVRFEISYDDRWKDIKEDEYERDVDGKVLDDPYLQAERGEVYIHGHGPDREVVDDENEGPKEETEEGRTKWRRSGARIRKAPKGPSRAERE